MLIWISIYSAFNTIDFNDEVVVLYGDFTFWGTIFLTFVIALGKISRFSRMSRSKLTSNIGPRFFVKFISSSFFPLDRDIIREMWVKGDLKSQLGIKSRKALKESAHNDAERMPIYQQGHDRSVSEGSQNAGNYEPAPIRSPGETGLDLVSPQTVGVNDTSEWREGSITSTAHSGMQYVIEGEPDESYTITAGAHRSPTHAPISPPPSYYSASEIPVPSPLPSPQYLHYGQGPLTPNSHSRSPGFVSATEPPRSANSLQPPGHDLSPNSYEMRVRSPPPSAGLHTNSPYLRATSRASDISNYATASERWDEASDTDEQTISHAYSSSNPLVPHAL